MKSGSIRSAFMPLPNPSQQFAYFQKRRRQILDTIQQLVEIESPSDVKAAVDRLGTVLASRFGELGGKVMIHPSEEYGNHLQINFGSTRGRKSVLLLGHMDTVYPIGTISKMSFRVAKGRVFGPGVLDMKAGIALALHVLEALIVWNGSRMPRPITIFFVSDEEVGSVSSRAITEKLARQSAAVLVLEPAAGLNGAVKTARKGVGSYTLQVKGVAAHSGLDFEKGQNAILELARQIIDIASLSQGLKGVTVNVGKISGGTRVNVVPAEASAVMDVRVSSSVEADEMRHRLSTLQPLNPHCKLSINGGMNRPPMERNEGVASLYAKAQQIARDLGWQLDEAAVGGGSDGNFTAALGIPTLDGLGAVGESAHAEHESVLISELPRRAALLAGLILAI